MIILYILRFILLLPIALIPLLLGFLCMLLRARTLAVYFMALGLYTVLPKHVVDEIGSV